MNKHTTFSMEIEDEYCLISEPNASTSLVFLRICYDNQMGSLAPRDFMNN